ncbi:hypothetical protein TWF225_001376 [Orbilia oligospora]|uniref:Uncharacterized protein n=1 Tax=Orbilia oligospora TaxID=2813651 RepID=A0A7C8KEU5_ORBOL|nr:hypothetical protein TWF751_008914 [Orbilia oligospora]KAF3191223.1 hypothetical protein TWF225_001376 [Orbilia oligospora]KAF3249621.1 hypothetical protein TWF217_008825 [Orbilia oligospora]KAF3269397.1 hypothetical protein TWF128_005634 [Orbilia oligospora]KAF3296696.1 hypothetical protein TWF132_010270 [Orbilia oligospora]
MVLRTLSEGLSDAISDYISSNPASKSNHENASQYLPGGNTRSVLYTSPFPITFVFANGITISSADGCTYLDFLGEYTAGLFGHSNEQIKNAIQGAVESGWGFGGVGVWEGQLARRVCERFGIERCRFTNSGTEANLMAIAVAKAVTQKKKILVFGGAYHGSVLAFPSTELQSPLNVPHEFIIGPYNDTKYIQCLQKDLTIINDLAAILVEQMQGAGGCHVASPEFLQSLRELADITKSILIFDEVMTSRLYPGGLQSYHGVKPDMTTLGKYLAGGSSFGCFGGKEEIMKAFDEGRSDGGLVLSHPGTFNNNVISMRAGCVALEILTDDVLVEMNTLGEGMRKELNELCIKYGVQERMWVTGVGSLMALHFGERKEGDDFREYVKVKNQDAEDLFWFWMVENGVYLARRGFVALTIEHRKEHVERFLEVAEGFLKTWAHVFR